MSTSSAITGHIFAPPRLPPNSPLAYREFWSLWRKERFFECHEVLELLWRETRGRQRIFYNGLINCAVALYQQGRGNAEGAARQFVRAEMKLQPFGARHEGVNIESLMVSVKEALQPSFGQLNNKQRARLEPLRALLMKRIEREWAADA